MRGVPYSGRGIGVALIDSGIVNSGDLNNILFFDFTHGGQPGPPVDDYGHGTHVAGLIGSSGRLSRGQYDGLAPGVHFIAMKVLDATGGGQTSDVIAAIDFAVANRRLLDVDVINLSLGHPIYEPAASDPLVQAVEHAVAAGIVVVTSAGNFGGDPVHAHAGLRGHHVARQRAGRRSPSARST